MQGRRRSLQEPEWLRFAAASLLLPTSAAPPCGESAVATDTQAGLAAPARDVPQGGGAAEEGEEDEGDDDDNDYDEGAPQWLLQAEATLASSSAALFVPERPAR